MAQGMENKLSSQRTRESQLLRAVPTSANKIVMWDELIDLMCEDRYAAPDKILLSWFRDLKARILDGDMQVYIKPALAKDRQAFLKRLAESPDDDFDVLSGCLFDSDRLATHGRLFDTAHMNEMGG